eukprot:g49614.t1
MASPITADDFSTQVQIHSALSAPAPNASAPSPSPTAPSVAQTPKVVHISSVEVPPEISERELYPLQSADRPNIHICIFSSFLLLSSVGVISRIIHISSNFHPIFSISSTLMKSEEATILGCSLWQL